MKLLLVLLLFLISCEEKKTVCHVDYICEKGDENCKKLETEKDIKFCEELLKKSGFNSE